MLSSEFRGWKVRKGVLISPEGEETTQTQLRGYFLIMQFARELASKDPSSYEEFHKLLKMA